jgi:hypothetical protein
LFVCFLHLPVIPSVHLPSFSHWFSQFRCSNLSDLSFFGTKNNYDDEDGHDDGDGGGGGGGDDNDDDGGDDMH